MRQPTLTKYDPQSVDSIAAYSHYLIMKGQLLGLATIDGHRPSPEEKELKREISRTCERMAKTLSGCAPGEIAELTGYYTLLYTMGYHRLPEASLMERQRERLLKQWLAGDRTIRESDVYGMLMDTVKNPMLAVPAPQRQALEKLRADWAATLKKHATFPDATAYECYRRLSLVMKDDVDSYLDGDSSEAKAKWYNKNRISDLTATGTKILTAYRQFVRSLFPAVLDWGGMLALDIAVLRELATRKDLDPYDRKAYEMALAFETRPNP